MRRSDLLLGRWWSVTLWMVPFLAPLISSSPINRQVGISENVFITIQNDTYGNEQRVCSIDSMTYYDGDSIPTSSACEHCICRPPGFACTIISCEYRPGCKAIKRSNQCCPEYQCECEKDGKIYQNGEKILDDNNPCEVCYCQGGDVICAVIDCYWRSDCQPRYIENRCCPLYDHCPPPMHKGPLRTTTQRPTTSTLGSSFPWFNFSSSANPEPSTTTALSTTSSTTTSTTTTTTTTSTTTEAPSSSSESNENFILVKNPEVAEEQPQNIIPEVDYSSNVVEVNKGQSQEIVKNQENAPVEVEERPSTLIFSPAPVPIVVEAIPIQAQVLSISQQMPSNTEEEVPPPIIVSSAVEVEPTATTASSMATESLVTVTVSHHSQITEVEEPPQVYEVAPAISESVANQKLPSLEPSFSLELVKIPSSIEENEIVNLVATPDKEEEKENQVPEQIVPTTPHISSDQVQIVLANNLQKHEEKEEEDKMNELTNAVVPEENDQIHNSKPESLVMTAAIEQEIQKEQTEAEENKEILISPEIQKETQVYLEPLQVVEVTTGSTTYSKVEEEEEKAEIEPEVSTIQPAIQNYAAEVDIKSNENESVTEIVKPHKIEVEEEEEEELVAITTESSPPKENIYIVNAEPEISHEVNEKSEATTVRTEEEAEEIININNDEVSEIQGDQAAVESTTIISPQIHHDEHKSSESDNQIVFQNAVNDQPSVTTLTPQHDDDDEEEQVVTTFTPPIIPLKTDEVDEQQILVEQIAQDPPAEPEIIQTTALPLQDEANIESEKVQVHDNDDESPSASGKEEVIVTTLKSELTESEGGRERSDLDLTQDDIDDNDKVSVDGDHILYAENAETTRIPLILSHRNDEFVQDKIVKVEEVEEVTALNVPVVPEEKFRIDLSIFGQDDDDDEEVEKVTEIVRDESDVSKTHVTTQEPIYEREENRVIFEAANEEHSTNSPHEPVPRDDVTENELAAELHKKDDMNKFRIFENLMDEEEKEEEAEKEVLSQTTQVTIVVRNDDLSETTVINSFRHHHPDHKEEEEVKTTMASITNEEALRQNDLFKEEDEESGATTISNNFRHHHPDHKEENEIQEATTISLKKNIEEESESESKFRLDLHFSSSSEEEDEKSRPTSLPEVFEREEINEKVPTTPFPSLFRHSEEVKTENLYNAEITTERVLSFRHDLSEIFSGEEKEENEIVNNNNNIKSDAHSSLSGTERTEESDSTVVPHSDFVEESEQKQVTENILQDEQISQGTTPIASFREEEVTTVVLKQDDDKDEVTEKHPNLFRSGLEDISGSVENENIEVDASTIIPPIGLYHYTVENNEKSEKVTDQPQQYRQEEEINQVVTENQVIVNEQELNFDDHQTTIRTAATAAVEELVEEKHTQEIVSVDKERQEPAVFEETTVKIVNDDVHEEIIQTTVATQRKRQEEVEEEEDDEDEEEDESQEKTTAAIPVSSTLSNNITNNNSSSQLEDHSNKFGEKEMPNEIVPFSDDLESAYGMRERSDLFNSVKNEMASTDETWLYRAFNRLMPFFNRQPRGTDGSEKVKNSKVEGEKEKMKKEKLKKFKNGLNKTKEMKKPYNGFWPKIMFN